jgi:hypothetical protein
MFQTIQGRDVFVVDLQELPQLPVNDGGSPELAPYAQALTTAIMQGVIKEPGKYGIEVTKSGEHWNVFAINE